MNKRQAKKAFKKKYGMNPAQFSRELNNLTLKINDFDWEAVGKAISEAIQETAKAMNETIQRVCDFINTPEFQEALREYKNER